jgi:hypothetical protein
MRRQGTLDRLELAGSTAWSNGVLCKVSSHIDPFSKAQSERRSSLSEKGGAWQVQSQLLPRQSLDAPGSIRGRGVEEVWGVIASVRKRICDRDGESLDTLFFDECDGAPTEAASDHACAERANVESDFNREV